MANGNDKKKKELYLRNVTFGVEDSLVSTVGLISGVAVAGLTRQTILLTGIVLILVEAFSMGMGSLLTEHSVEEYEERKETPLTEPILAGAIMFISYFLSGFVPLSPYFFFSGQISLLLSNILSLFVLFILGAVSAKIFHINVLRHSLEMLVLGGTATIVGVIAGIFLHL